MSNSKRTCLLQAGLQTFLKAYNFAKRLKTLKGLTPYEKVIEGWHKEPERFTINSLQHTAGLYNQTIQRNDDMPFCFFHRAAVGVAHE